jgi:hypothetical protein
VWNKDKSVASFSHQVAARIPDLFYNIYLMKNHNIANNSTTTEVKVKSEDIFGIIRIFENMEVCLARFKKQSNFTLIKLATDI